MVLPNWPVSYPIAFNAVAMVGAWSGIPIFAPAWPTVVMPVRIGSSPVMKLAAVQRHHSLVIRADVEPTNVVAHDEDDVWFAGLCQSCKRPDEFQDCYDQSLSRVPLHQHSQFPFRTR
jgi:hypothetical protein